MRILTGQPHGLKTWLSPPRAISFLSRGSLANAKDLVVPGSKSSWEEHPEAAYPNKSQIIFMELPGERAEGWLDKFHQEICFSSLLSFCLFFPMYSNVECGKRDIFSISFPGKKTFG